MPRLPSAPPSARVAVGATVLAAVLWGTSFNVNDIGLRSVGPASFSFLRFALAGIVTLFIAAALGRFSFAPVKRPWFWALAAANAIGFLLQYEGQTFTTPARTALFVNSSAFAVAIFERVFFHERLGARRVLALLVGLGGAALLIVGGDPARLSGGRLVGDLLTLASGLAWAIFFVMNRKALGEGDPLNVTAWTFALSAVVLVPFLWSDAAPLHVTSALGFLTIGYAGLVTTALAYGLWAFGLRTLRASVSAVLLLVEILVASTVSFSIGRESFGWIEAIGAVLLVAAVVTMSFVAEKDAKGEPANEPV